MIEYFQPGSEVGMSVKTTKVGRTILFRMAQIDEITISELVRRALNEYARKYHSYWLTQDDEL